MFVLRAGSVSLFSTCAKKVEYRYTVYTLLGWILNSIPKNARATNSSTVSISSRHKIYGKSGRWSSKATGAGKSAMHG